MAEFERHLFLCVNEREAGNPRGCCADKGSVEIASALKKSAYDRGLKRIVRVNKSGCLDQCARGVTCVVYPEVVWYGGVTLADVDDIVEQHLAGGRPLERLIIAPEQLTGKARGADAPGRLPSMRTNLDEESKHILRRIIESLARHQLASINTLGHCLKYVEGIDAKVVVAEELELSLRLFREVRAIYADLGWTELESAVRDRLNELPVPASRLEFGVAYYLGGQAESVAMQAYEDSSCPEFASIARSHIEAAARRPEPKRFIEYCTDATHRPQAQQFVDRWARVASRSFGRPNSGADARAVELGIRHKSTARMTAEFKERLEPFLARCRLQYPG